MRWLVLDEIVQIRKGFSATSRGRIPKESVSAEVLMIEMMAQTAGVLLGAENEFKDNVVFAKIELCEFPQEPQAGEKVEIKASSTALRSEGSWMDASVQNERAVFANARLMLVTAGELVPGKIGSITFHQDFMNHFKIRQKIQ